jgi:hypothetical protein
MTIITHMQITKAQKRIDQQRRSGCCLYITEERRRHARQCMPEIIAGTVAQDRAERIIYDEPSFYGGGV